MTKKLAFAFLLLLGVSDVAFAQCAMCKTLLTNSPEGRALSGRFDIAILLLLIAPYAVAAAVFFTAFRSRVLSWFASGSGKRTLRSLRVRETFARR